MKEYLNKVINDDCLSFMAKLPDNCIDAIVTDPPYELGFMGKKWDKTGIAYNVDLWRECLRILKAGGHLLAFGGTRTYHRMACAIEDAGFEIRDQLQWLYASGFPKSLNISKAVDKKFGAKREIVGKYKSPENTSGNNGSTNFGNNTKKDGLAILTKPNTTQAKQWDGWGTALKPAHEPICMARKPLAEKTVCDNVLKYGTGGINIDACRIGIDKNKPKEQIETQGRFPSNIILSHHPECKEIGVKEVKSGLAINENRNNIKSKNIYSDYKKMKGSNSGYGKETVPNYECHPDCAVKILDEQSGVSRSPDTYLRKSDGFSTGNSSINNIGEKAGKISINFNDTGTASRFFYCAKTSKTERNNGCENLEKKQMETDGVNRNQAGFNSKDRKQMLFRYNFHPTVKPKKLMEYLIKLVTPKNGVVLDCFAGSGSTLIACKSLGFDFIGIEKEFKYCDIANERIKAEQAQGKLNLV